MGTLGMLGWALGGGGGGAEPGARGASACPPVGSRASAISVRPALAAAAGLFSATQTEAVEALARAGLRNPGKCKCCPAAGDGALGWCYWQSRPALLGSPQPSAAGHDICGRLSSIAAVRINVAVTLAQPKGPKGKKAAGGAAEMVQRTPSTLQIQVSAGAGMIVQAME